MKHLRSIFSILLVTIVAAGAVVLVVFLSSRGSGTGEARGTYHSPTVFAMDTSLDITIQGRGTAVAQADSRAATAAARRVESHTSRFVKDSDVSLINANAGAAPVKVHDDTMYLVKKSLEYARLTGGAFDITVSPIAELWGFYSQDYRVPSQAEIDRTLPLVDYTRVLVDEANGTVMLAGKGMSIDLGGVAKGYAVERMYGLLKERGVESALVNFGGAVGALGRRVDGKKWVIGIKHPRAGGGALAGEIQVESAFVSSSGDYERFFMSDGKRYCHIFDPSTDFQPREVISTTVVGPDSTVADILSTTLFVMGPGKGLDFMKSQPGFQALVIDNTGKFLFTPNMKSKYVITTMERI